MREKEEKILRAVAAVLSRDGAGGFTMRKAAAVAGLSLGNLQYYFKTKELLFTGLFEFYLEGFEKQLDGLTDSISEKDKKEGKKTLRLIIRDILDDYAIVECDEIESIFFSLADLEGISQDLLDDFYRRLYDKMYKLLAGICPEAPKKKIHRGTSLLFPYIIGYHELNPYLHMSSETTAKLLSGAVWEALGH